jgi:alkyldihydroxyacetonephosphate synthase
MSLLPDFGGLAARLSPEAALSTSSASRITYARDCWPRLQLQARAGRHAIHPPDAVVSPATPGDVLTVVNWCAERGVPLVAFGAGSGVCGASVPVRGGITLDLKRLLSLDTSRIASGLIRAGAGWIGQRLEHELNRLGYTLGHFPSSIGCSTVGGYVATRSAGQYSTRFGKIEDMVVGVRFVDGRGEVRDSFSVDQDITALLVGSEGTFGVITDVWLHVEPHGVHRAFRGFWAPSLDHGLDAMRRALQAGHQPAVFRLYDPFDSFISGARKAVDEPLRMPTERRPAAAPDTLPGWLPEGLSPRQARSAAFAAANAVLSRTPLSMRLLRRLAERVETGCLLIAGVEEHDANDAALLGDSLFADLRASLQDLGPGPGNYWFAHRHDVSFKMPTLLRAGMFVDTMEVTADWSRVAGLYGAVREAISPHAFVMAHFSHAYTTGSSIYFTFAGFGRDNEDCLDRYDQIWRLGLEAVTRFGGSATHHHGVGLLKAPWLRHDQPGAEARFDSLRELLDPAGVLNPGKLWNAEGAR